MEATLENLKWPEAGISRVPYWAYSDPGIYAREQERVFGGKSWAYVALEAEIPEPGDYKRTFIGEKPVIVTRDLQGGINVVENRCAHRGVQFCQKHLGHAKEFMCPYHQWNYDLKGNLIGVPFRRGVKKQGGMPAIRPMGWQGTELEVRANYLALETLLDEPSRVFMCGEYRDRLVVTDGKLKFKEKHCVFDTLLVLNSLIYRL